jgi:hypothetical protein
MIDLVSFSVQASRRSGGRRLIQPQAISSPVLSPMGLMVLLPQEEQRWT